MIELKLKQTNTDSAERLTRAIILVPTKELCEQVTSHLKQLCKYCEEDVHVVNLSQGSPAMVQKYVLGPTFDRVTE
jgi:ATP-dependent RNA helicase DDX56/DBP9